MASIDTPPMTAAGEPHPQTWYSTHLVGVPAPLPASTAFNAHPQPLCIASTREAHHGLFALLQRCASLGRLPHREGRRPLAQQLHPAAAGPAV